MNQADHSPPGVRDKNGAAISYVDPEAHPTLVCDQSVAAFKAFIEGLRRSDNPDFFSVNLLGGNERHVAESMIDSDLPMNSIQSGKCFRLLVRHLNAGHAQGESMHETRNRG